MKKIFTLLFVKSAFFFLCMCITASVLSQPIAQWTFDGVTFSSTPSTTPVLTGGTTTADVGSQTAGSAFSGLHASSATVWSTPSGNGSTKSMSSNNWAVGDYYQFQASTTGNTGIAVIFDQTNSSTGPFQFKLQYSTDGTSFTDFTTYNVPNNAGAIYAWSATTPVAASTLSFDLSAVTALNNKPAVYFRLVNNGTTTVSGGTVASTGTNRVDNFSIWQASVLPLSLTSFKATLAGTTANLSWTSQNEVNVKGFSIEKSLNGREFSEIAFIKAANLSTTNSYRAEDGNVKAGVNYYRLKMVDMDGSARYSNIVTLSSKNFTKVEVFPNPAFGTLNISHDKADIGATMRIMSIDGKQVKVIPVETGALQTSLSIGELIKGNYLLIFEANGEKTTSKFTKQ